MRATYRWRCTEQKHESQASVIAAYQHRAFLRNFPFGLVVGVNVFCSHKATVSMVTKKDECLSLRRRNPREINCLILSLERGSPHGPFRYTPLPISSQSIYI